MSSLRERIKKATDKLFKQPITVKVLNDGYNSFGESLNESYTEYNLLGLFVTKKEIYEKEKGGEADLHDGYCQFNTIDLETVGLLVDNQLLAKEDSLLIFGGQTYEITGIIPVAPDFILGGSVFVLYQFMVRKQLIGTHG